MTDSNTISSAKPGWHIWLVGVFGILWNGFGCFDFTMTASRNMDYLGGFPKEMLHYWFAMPWWMYGVWAVGVFGALAGSIALLLRSKASVTLFAAALIASVISFYIGWTDPGAPKMEGAEMFPIVIMALGFGFTVYAYWQSTRGVLR